MAINVIGVAGSMGVEEWARLGNRLSSPVKGAGMSASVSGTRGITVAAGDRYQAGTLLESSSAVTVSATANTSGSPKLVTVCAQVNWVGTTEDTAGSIVMVEGASGTNPIAPGLTQNPGVLWQTPLATGRVESGATSVTNLIQIPISQVNARHSGFAIRNSDQAIFVSTWQPLIFTSTFKTISDYGLTPVNGSQLSCPVAGTYEVSGNCVIGPDNVGIRSARIARYNSSGTLVFAKRMPDQWASAFPAGGYVPVAFSGGMDANAGDYFQLEAWHASSTNSLFLKAIDGTGGMCSWVSHRLIQAD